MSSGYVKLWRSFEKWGWYPDLPCRVLFIHLLITVNRSKKVFMGEPINAGELATSIPKLAAATSLSDQQVRTALNKLRATGDITDRSTGQFRVVTLVNWAKWQAAEKDQQGDQQADQQAYDSPINRRTQRPATATKEGKKRERRRKNNSSNEELADGHLPLDPIEAVPVQGPRPEREDRRDPRINSVIDYLADQLKKNGIAPSLDGPQKDHRFMAQNLLNKMAKDYPEVDPVEKAKAVIDASMSIPFHARKSTHMSHLFKFAGQILAEAETKGKVFRPQDTAKRRDIDLTWND